MGKKMSIIKKQEHLPVYGIGPVYVAFILLLTLTAVLLRDRPILASGRILAFRIPIIFIGALFIALSIFLWIQAVLASNLAKHIEKNYLVTSGVFAWVRNPIYSAFMILCTGILFIVGNAWFIPLPFFYWGLLTVHMKNTEEKWLQERYGNAYLKYCGKVHRCWPSIPKGVKNKGEKEHDKRCF
uniref:methyltransferase family protein n=1 Tax=Ndongobacter massiliensis TaxID=1871025 RepID=UPI001E5D77DA|nr:isoprenylcysteine carboxylmethyltransferase family protein [Ndongobacter massiliensis]